MSFTKNVALPASSVPTSLIKTFMLNKNSKWRGVTVHSSNIKIKHYNDAQSKLVKNTVVISLSLRFLVIRRLQTVVRGRALFNLILLFG